VRGRGVLRNPYAVSCIAPVRWYRALRPGPLFAQLHLTCALGRWDHNPGNVRFIRVGAREREPQI
jgi:hypothetical protein